MGIIGMFFTWKKLFYIKTVEEAKKLSAEKVQSILLESDVAKIYVHPSPDESIYVKWKREVEKPKPTITMNKSTGWLKIHMQKESFLNLFNNDRFSPQIELFIPAFGIRHLSLNNGIGKVFVNNLSIGKLSLQTNVSNIAIEEVKASQIIAHSSVGKISIINSIGEIKSRNDVGKIHLVFDKITNDISAKTNVGNIFLETAKTQREANILAQSNLGETSLYGSKKQKYVSREAKFSVELVTDVGNIKVIERR